MLEKIWKLFILGGIAFAIGNNKISEINNALISGAEKAVTLCLSLCAIYGVWCGLMAIAKEGGVLKALSRILQPVIKFLFPESSHSTAVREALTMSISANLLGLGNAATPAGQKAISEMKKVNKTNNISKDMVMLLCLNNSALTLVPSTIIAMRAAAGSSSPASIFIGEFIASLIATITAIIAVKLFCRKKP